MAFLSTFILEKMNVILFSLGMLFVVIASPKLGKENSKKMIIIIALNFVATYLRNYETYLSNLTDWQNYPVSVDFLRTLFSVIGYTLNPLLALRFYMLMERKKEHIARYIPVILCGLLHVTAFFTGAVVFEIKDNAFRPSAILPLRYSSIILTFVYIVLILVRCFKNLNRKNLYENGILLLSAIAILIAALTDANTEGASTTDVTVLFVILFYYIYIHLQHIRQSDEYLKSLVHIDILTGLGNEASYISLMDEYEKDKNGEPYAVVVMDVNELKATNDKYGHDYGCHLIVECGHILPTVFPHSKIFHIGGDEFVAILTGEDFENRKKLMEKFGEKLYYTTVVFEGRELTLSVAAGIATHRKGNSYKATFQMADRNMYENKAYLKELYHISTR